jgi:hypothetical protein
MLTIGTMSFDKSLYNPGDTITFTVNYTSTDFTGTPNQNFEATATVSDTVSTTSSSLGFAVAGTGETVLPTTVSATDNRPTPGTWTLVSNVISGTAPTWTGVAVLTSVA